MWTPGQSQFWPQGYTLNNFDRGHLDDAIYFKYEGSGPCSFRLEEFYKFHFKNLFFSTPWPTLKPTGKIWTTLIGDHPGIIPVKFGQNPISGFRGDVV